ncbi:MAG TPA: UDP-N-acetylglucosamine pyrophosphorylase [candidate division Zixibacteria bacterium]|nr:UDP-N-acetylglucosamine pyrophosphorylase [candidate division Zixibacteria bacterium]HEQ99203.1 UDP-N-acetylglucosamine pyrophosphorylase [candidate division Zixibacteria bacterium]
MKSDLPKVLHDLKGKPIIQYLAETLKDMGLAKVVVVVGYKRHLVEEALADYEYDFAVQEKQLGTGHAVMMAEEALSDFEGDVLVLAGDVPFIRKETIKNLLDLHNRKDAAATVLTSEPPDPTGYGRVIKKSQDFVEKIVEHKDCSGEELRIGEINTGTFVFRKRELFENLKHIDNSNAQGEYYLTDLMEIFLKQGKKTAAFKTDDYREALGINSREQLEELAKAYNL